MGTSKSETGLILRTYLTEKSEINQRCTRNIGLKTLHLIPIFAQIKLIIAYFHVLEIYPRYKI